MQHCGSVYGDRGEVEGRGSKRMDDEKKKQGNKLFKRKEAENSRASQATRIHA